MGHDRERQGCPGRSGPRAAALEVKLATVPDANGPCPSRANGVYFRWRPPGMASASAACLSYALAARGLRLCRRRSAARPFRRPPPAASDPNAASGFGRASMAQRRRRPRRGRDRRAATSAPSARVAFRLRPGRWIRVEQEIVLNTPGKPTASSGCGSTASSWPRTQADRCAQDATARHFRRAAPTSATCASRGTRHAAALPLRDLRGR